MSWRRRTFQVALAAMILVSGGLLGGHLSVFGDTSTYVRQGEFLATRLHIASPLGEASPPAISMSLLPQAIAKNGAEVTRVVAARSPFYGFFLFVLSGLGSFWLAAYIQALAAAWLVYVTTRVVLPDRTDSAYWAAIVVLSLGSSLPFFADFAMPDIFGGLAYLAVALLILASDRISRHERLGLCVLMVAGLLFHRANAPVIVGILAAGVWVLKRRRLSVRAVAARSVVVVVGLVFAAVMSTLVFDAYHRETGYAQASPPFLMARVLLDGSGKAYLAANCPGGASPTLCSLKSRPMADEHDILWRTKDGVFGSADYETRRKLQDEEIPFVIAALAFDPVNAVTAAFRNWVSQLALTFVAEPLGDPVRFLSDPQTDAPALQYLKASTRLWTISGVRLKFVLLFWHGLILILSLLIVLWVGLDRRLRCADQGSDGAQLRLIRELGVLLLVGVLLNAAVFGILSGPYARYQARIIWLIPLAAVLGALALRRCAMRSPVPAAIPREAQPHGYAPVRAIARQTAQ